MFEIKMSAAKTGCGHFLFNGRFTRQTRRLCQM